MTFDLNIWYVGSSRLFLGKLWRSRSQVKVRRMKSVPFSAVQWMHATRWRIHSKSTGGSTDMLLTLREFVVQMVGVTSGPSLGHPCKFQRLSPLGSVTARQSSIERQPNFAALNRGRHLCSTGRPSGWAFAHILVSTNLPSILHRFQDIAFDKSKIAIFGYSSCI